MALSSRGKWVNTLEQLQDVEKGLKCNRCFQVAVKPQTFLNCQHFFCASCVDYSFNNCFVCGIPSSAREIYHDKFIENVTTYVLNIKKLINGLREGPHAEGPDGPQMAKKISLSVDSKASTQTSGNEQSGKDIFHEKHLEDPPILIPMVKSKAKQKPGRGKESHKLKASRESYAGKSHGFSDNAPPVSPSLNFNTLKEHGHMNSSVDTVKAQPSSIPMAKLPNETPLKQKLHLTGNKSKLRSVGKSNENSDVLTSPVQATGLCSSESITHKNVTHSTKKSANKRNAKGETPLHIGCKKGNLLQVKNLISNGANPNVKDNFGWTPLHEAIHYKHIDIAKVLIEEGGSMVNIPGGENITPLHKAVALNFVEGIKLLLQWGASPKLVDIYGNLPIKYVVTDEIADLLAGAGKCHTKGGLMASLCDDSDEEEDCIVFYCDNLSKSYYKVVLELSSLIPGGKVCNTLKADVTHIVVHAENGVCIRSISVLHGILTGRRIVSLDWVHHSIKMKSVKHDHNSGVKSTKNYPSSNGIIKARKCIKKMLPGLFSGMHFSISSACRILSYDGIKKEDIAALVCAGGGRFLSREPDPEAIPYREKTVPFYANNYVTELAGIEQEHPLKNCSHVILYHQDERESASQKLSKCFLRYNMAHLKSLPVAWFVGCIESFTILDPSPFL